MKNKAAQDLVSLRWSKATQEMKNYQGRLMTDARLKKMAKRRKRNEKRAVHNSKVNLEKSP